MGDFTGFSFGDNKSSDLGITRVSGGDRYEEQLHPDINDRTAEVPGLDGQYYFGSDFGPKTIDIEFAFDHLTESQFRKLRQVFGTKHIRKLVFDESPYKYYMAKIESPVELSYVCFYEPKKRQETIDGIRYKEDDVYKTSHVVMRNTDIKERIYKGEGTVTFICYFPFAKSNFKVLPEAGDEYYEGSEEWATSSGILSANDSRLEEIDHFVNNRIMVYNPGDLPTGFRLYCPFTTMGNQITLQYRPNELSDYDILVITEPHPKRNGGTEENPINDEGFLIDTNNNLIVGVSSFSSNIITTSGNLYNECIDAGYFFKIQPSEYTVDEYNNITIAHDAFISITNGNNGMQIFYDYLYF